MAVDDFRRFHHRRIRRLCLLQLKPRLFGGTLLQLFLVGQQVVADGRVETRAVQAGAIWQGRREILSGLQPGEQVITRAGAFFRDGDRVVPVTEDASAAPTPPQDGAQAEAQP